MWPMAAVKFQIDESTIRRWKKRLQDISNDKENNESIPNSAVLDQTENNKKENNNTKNVVDFLTKLERCPIQLQKYLIKNLLVVFCLIL